MNKLLKNIILTPFNVLYGINPIFEQKLMFRLKCGYRINLHNPITYNEKLNWLKLYNRDPLIVKCADKYSAREYISECGYADHLPKLYWHGNNPDSIPFDTLPNQFVIKSTSGSGNNIIVRNKYNLDIKRTCKIINRWQKEKYLIAYGEWHYMQIKPSIIIEEYLSDGQNQVPMDYKFYYFNNLNHVGGGIGLIEVDIDRFSSHKRNLYNTKWELMRDVKYAFETAPNIFTPKPDLLDDMVNVAIKLSKPFPHARVDFYVIGSNYYIGEITFFSGAGYDAVEPREFNETMGSWIEIPQIS